MEMLFRYVPNLCDGSIFELGNEERGVADAALASTLSVTSNCFSDSLRVDSIVNRDICASFCGSINSVGAPGFGKTGPSHIDD